MPKSLPLFNYHTDILTVMETAEWPQSSFVLLHTFINVLVGKTLGYIASTWHMKVSLFILKWPLLGTFSKAFPFYYIERVIPRRTIFPIAPTPNQSEDNTGSKGAWETENIPSCCMAVYRDKTAIKRPDGIKCLLQFVSLKSLHLCRFKKYTTT